MPFYGGSELANVYDDALEKGFGLVASNIAEPNILMGLMEGAARADSDLLLQLSGGAATFAGNEDPVDGLKAGKVSIGFAETGTTRKCADFGNVVPCCLGPDNCVWTCAECAKPMVITRIRPATGSTGSWGRFKVGGLAPQR